MLGSESRQRLSGRAGVDGSSISEPTGLGFSDAAPVVGRKWRLGQRRVHRRQSAAALASPLSSSHVDGIFAAAAPGSDHRRWLNRRRISLASFGTAASVFGFRRPLHRRRVSLARRRLLQHRSLFRRPPPAVLPPLSRSDRYRRSLSPPDVRSETSNRHRPAFSHSDIEIKYRDNLYDDDMPYRILNVK